MNKETGDSKVLPRRSRSRSRISPVPWWLTAIAVAGICVLILPLVFLGTKAPWGQMGTVLGGQAAQEALRLSLRTCLVAVVIDLVLGIPLAVLLSRNWRGVRVARVLVALPLSLPPVVAGLALLLTFGRRGVLGSTLDAWGIHIAFSTTAVIMAQVFVSLPFLVVTLEAALRARPQGMEETAVGLGAGPSRVLWAVTLPMVRIGIVRGVALAAARCLGEFGATITFAGNLEGVTQTMPLQIYLAREIDQDTAVALGMVLLAMAIVVVGLTEWPLWVHRHRKARFIAEESETDHILTVGRATHKRQNQAIAVHISGEVVARNWRVSLDLSPGELVAVMGHNGAGKSTLAELLAGRMALDSGEMRLGGRIVDGPTSFIAARNRRVALVSQQPMLFSHMSVLDNVAFPLRCRGVKRAEARKIAHDQLKSVSCNGLASRRGDELSGGQSARIALARAMVFHPDLLVLDEPTASLDSQATDAVNMIIAARQKAVGMTTLLITHDEKQANLLASRCVRFEHGKIIKDTPPFYEV